MNRISRRTFGAMAIATTAAGPARAAKPDIVIPMRMAENQPQVQVTINGTGPYTFIMATGHLYAVIRKTLAQSLGLKESLSVSGTTLAGHVPLELFWADTFNLGGAWDMGKMQFIGRPIADDGEIQGVFPFLPRSKTTLDFEVPEMRVHRDPVKPPPGAFRAGTLHATGISPSIIRPYVTGELDGQRLKLLIDTGSTGALMLYPDAVRRLKLWDQQSQTAWRQTDEDGRDVEWRMARGGALVFGGQTFTRPSIRLMSPSYTDEDIIFADGEVGMEILRRFRITFDPVRRTVWFVPNSKIGEAFPEVSPAA